MAKTTISANIVLAFLREGRVEIIATGSIRRCYGNEEQKKPHCAGKLPQEGCPKGFNH